MSVFTYDSDSFYLDGKPMRILSGSIHYFRTVPEYWRDRLRKLKQCGFNTVETYTCWNLHERIENCFDFSGILDLGRFLDIAAEEGLFAIVRPGPYICAEWDYGGLPSWLLKYENMRVRCRDARFLEKEKRYLTELFRILVPRLVTHNGNVLMLQVENEYGSFGNDHGYLRELASFYRESGVDTVLFTSDGPGELFIGGGRIENTLTTVNFGSDHERWFALLKKLCPNQPLMCSEYWEGWFDTWYEPHHRRQPDDVAMQLDSILSMNGNINFYMFCGGTNFGFNNGANVYDNVFSPQTTSYDYDAILTEEGDLTPRYHEVRKIAEKHFGKLPLLTVCNTPKESYGRVKLNKYASLFDSLSAFSSPVRNAYPLSFEELGIDFGFVLYRTVLDYPFENAKLVIEPLRDRAMIFVNGAFAGVKERSRSDTEVLISVPEGGKTQIDILVENLGRVNYGETMSDNKKGLIGGARLGQQYIFDWEMYALPMEDLSSLVFSESDDTSFPAFLSGSFNIENAPADTYVRLDGFHKGFVKVNGFNIGRYWNDAGPQKTLYVPAPILKKGENTVTVFELHGCDEPAITLTDKKDLG